jgi:hypothetical protein
MKILRLPSPISWPSVPLGFGYHYVAPFSMSDRVETITRLTWIILVRTTRKSAFRVEAGGSPKFPWKPIVHLPCSQTPTGLSTLTNIGLSVLSLSQRQQRLHVKNTISRLYHTAFVLPVYASCRHLYPLRNTRFRLLVRLYRAGLVTCRFPTKGFKELIYPPFTGLAWRNGVQ